jgi:hypothetical protein
MQVTAALHGEARSACMRAHLMQSVSVIDHLAVSTTHPCTASLMQRLDFAAVDAADAERKTAASVHGRALKDRACSALKSRMHARTYVLHGCAIDRQVWICIAP